MLEYKCLSPETLEETHEEFHTLHRLWNQFAYEQQNDAASRGVHMAPAMWQHLGAMVAGNNPLDPLADVLEPTGETATAATVAMSHIAYFGDILFQFGQFCSARGLPYGNLTPCSCATVTDEDLQKLIGKPHEKGSSADG